MRADVIMSRTVASAHGLPSTVGGPSSRSQAVQDRMLWPPSSMSATVRTAAASSGTSATPSRP
jgi:hypothetical protein